MDGKEDHLLKVEEEGIAGKNASIERDIGPCVKLQDPGVSPLATQEDVRSLTPPSSSSPITPKAASMQRSLVVNTGASATPEPESDGDDFWTVEEDVAHAHPDRAELDPLMDEPESDDEAEETFCAEMSGMEDEEAFDRAGLEGRLVKEDEEWDADEEAGAVITPRVEDAPCTESRPVPHNALHAPAHSHTLAAPRAPDEEEVPLQTLSLRGEHAAKWLSWMLLERVWAMWHTIWILMPVWGRNVGAHNPDGSQPNTPTCEGRRPSLDVDARTYQTAEQDTQVASAALLEGEEKRTLSVSSEQAAVPGTPSTFDTPSLPLTITPADSEATPQPRTHTRMRAPKPLCIAHKFQSGRVVHPGTSPPLPDALPVHLWGLCGRPRGSRGSDDSGRLCAGTHSQTPMAQRRHSRPETTDTDAPDPRMLTEAKRSPEPHKLATRTHPRAITAEAPCTLQLAYIDAAPPLSLHRPSTRERSRVLHHMQRAQSHKESNGQHRPHRHPHGGLCHSKHQARSLGGRQAGPPPPLLACVPRRAAHWRAIQMRPAAWPGTGAPYSGTRSPSTAPPPPPSHPRSGCPPLGAANVAASSGHAHWETVKQILSTTSPTHPTRISHTRRSAAHRRAIQTRWQQCHGPVHHIGACVPHHQERHTAVTHSGKEASWPRSPASYTTRKQHDHHMQPPSSITTRATQAACRKLTTLFK